MSFSSSHAIYLPAPPPLATHYTNRSAVYGAVKLRSRAAQRLAGRKPLSRAPCSVTTASRLNRKHSPAIYKVPNAQCVTTKQTITLIHLHLRKKALNYPSLTGGGRILQIPAFSAIGLIFAM